MYFYLQIFFSLEFRFPSSNKKFKKEKIYFFFFPWFQTSVYNLTHRRTHIDNLIFHRIRWMSANEMRFKSLRFSETTLCYGFVSRARRQEIFQMLNTTRKQNKKLKKRYRRGKSFKIFILKTENNVAINYTSVCCLIQLTAGSNSGIPFTS